VSRKSARIQALIQEVVEGNAFDPHYLGYFACFNRQLFYDAHDVLEEMWLPQRQGPNGSFYKGLIQLAGAFVHLQKQRLSPAGALLRLARGNLSSYPGVHEGIQMREILALIECWLGLLEDGAFQSRQILDTSAG